MKTAIKLILASLFLTSVLTSVSAREQYTVTDVPNVHRLDGNAYVSDPEVLLSPAAKAQINSRLAQLEQTKGVQTAVVVLNSIGSDTPENFAVSLFEAWGIGKKENNTGLLILLVTEQRYIRFEVGYGLEGTLTDALSKRIQSRSMNSHFAAEQWDEGLIAGIDDLSALLNDPSSELYASAQPEGFDGGLIVMLVAMAVMIIIAFVAQRKARKCPKCGSRMKIIGRDTAQLSRNARLVTTTYQCPKCGYTMRKRYTEQGGGGIAGGMGGAIGGMRGFGGGIGGGGFGGGFGGGRSGGGGATSRF